MSKTIVTHDSAYHADDVFAVATLLLVYPDAKIVRSRDQTVIDAADIAVDTGGVYDPEKSRFDHHQPEGAGMHPDPEVPYASFGLVWKEFGEKLTGSKEAAEVIEMKIAVPIDAIDNGVDIAKPIIEGVRAYSIHDFFYSFAKTGSTAEDLNAAFATVVDIAKGILIREIANAQEDARDWTEVAKVYAASENKQIVILPRIMSYKKVLIPSEAMYVIYERPDKKWAARAMPDKPHSFGLKKPFPESWAGLRDAELALASGVSDAAFCHRGRFIAGAWSKEGALALANKALEQ